MTLKNKDLTKHKLLNMLLAFLIIFLVVYWEIQRAEYKQIEAAPVIFSTETSSKELSTNQSAGHLADTILPEQWWKIQLSRVDTGAGKVIQLRNFQKKPLVIHFWATWCEPCMTEFPLFLDFLAKFSQKPGTPQFLAINVDSEIDVGRFLREKQWFRPHLQILADQSQLTTNILGISKFPETLIVDRNGKVLRHLIGAQDWQSQEMLDIVTSIK